MVLRQNPQIDPAIRHGFTDVHTTDIGMPTEDGVALRRSTIKRYVVLFRTRRLFKEHHLQMIVRANARRTHTDFSRIGFCRSH